MKLELSNRKWYKRLPHTRDVVAQYGDVVAQLAKATGRHQTEDAAVPGSNPAPPQSPERDLSPSL
jgi:hypothetical protein